ncbi:MAG: DUF1801 domain-containing protein [Phycisphaerales bacterium]
MARKITKASTRKASKKVAKKAAEKSATKRVNSTATANPATPKLLSGGNPQIPKGDGDGPVQAYIAAMPGWKGNIGRRLDELIVATVPSARKAVRWNTPFYGIEGRGWFIAFHCMTRYIKVTFFNGASLKPPPPIESKYPAVRYFHIHEDDALDEAQLTKWIKQAAKLPGETCF